MTRSTTSLAQVFSAMGTIASRTGYPAGDASVAEVPPISSRTVVHTTPAAGQRIYEGQAIGDGSDKVAILPLFAFRLFT